MTKQSLLLILSFGLGVGFSLTSAAPVPDKADASRVSRLIEQLGSADFKAREKATLALDALGASALEALKKAATSDDPEVRRRAEDLVAKIERKAASEKALTPKKVRLVLKDLPVADAVAELRKQSGYDVVLADPAGKLKDRKVSLETGETTFWQALDRLCVAASLVESADANPVPPPPVGRPGIQGARIQPPLPPIQIEVEAPAILPVQPPQPAPKPGAVPQLKPAQKALAQPGEPVPDQEEKVAQPLPVGKPAPRPLPVRPIKPLPPVGLRPPLNVIDQPVRITLVDGKPAELPTAYVGALRVRALPRGEVPQAPGQNEMVVGLITSLEPLLAGQDDFRVRIDKAVDDQGQELSPMTTGVEMTPARGAFIRAMPVMMRRNLHQTLHTSLKKGEKPSRLLKELSGTISGNAATAPKEMIVADNLTKAAGKTFKGAEGGAIKVVDVSKDNQGRFQVRYDLELPPGVPNQGNGGFGVMPIQGVPIQVRPVPVLPVPQQAVPLPPGAFQAQAQVQIQIGGAAVWGGGAGFPNSVTALDDKGNVLHPVGTGTTIRKDANGIRREIILTFAPGVEPAKLVYKSSKPIAFEAAFTLKNVPLP